LGLKSQAKHCATCKLEFKSNYKYCTQCGKELNSQISCPSCNYQLPKNTNNNFCLNCGVNIKTKLLAKSSNQSNKKLKTRPNNVKDKKELMSTNNQLKIGVGIIIAVIIYLFFWQDNGLKTLNPTIRMPNGFEMKYSTCLAYDSEQNCKDYFNNNKSDWIIVRLG
jgi:hypothetical protein